MKNVMKNISWIVIMAMVVGLCITFIPTNTIANATTIAEEKTYCTATLEDDFADDVIMVTITNAVSIGSKQYTADDFESINCIEVVDMYGNVDFNDNYNLESFHRILILKILYPSKQNVLNAIKILEQRSDILYAEPNYYIEEVGTLDDGIMPASIGDTNDTDWWQDTIDLALAHQIESGTYEVEIAVIDKGIYANHIAFRNNNNIHTAYAKYFEDGQVYSWQQYATTDTTGHGTHIAGILGAEKVDTAGMSGVCQDVGIIPYTISSPENGQAFEVVDVTRAIICAQEENIPIINMSLVCESNASLNVFYSAIANYPGLMVAGAGNSVVDIDNDNDYYHVYPTEHDLDNMIVVGNSTINNDIYLDTTDPNPTKWKGSNWGATSVDLFAPGTNIYSTDNLGGYTYDTGTSYAAPMVAGVAALLLAQDPTMDATELKAILMGTVEEHASLTNKCVSGGVLNAYNALSHSHSFTYINNGTSGHTATCSGCGYVEEAVHSCTYASNNVNTHTGDCLFCNYTITETHTWLNAPTGNGWKCWICGMTTLIKPVINPGYLSIGGEIYVVDEEWCCKLSDLVLIDGQYYMRAENTLATQEIEHLLM